MTTVLTGTSRLIKALETLDRGARDLNLTQVTLLLHVAHAGDNGIDQGRLAELAGASPASVSRTVRILGDMHYDKSRAGYGLVSFDFDPTDNRKRVVRLTAAGKRLIERVVSDL